MPYQQISITIPVRYSAGLADMLMRSGSLGMYEHADGCTAYFPADHDLTPVVWELEVITALIRHASADATVGYDVSLLPDADWNASWKRSFQPVPAGERFLILPPWEQACSGRIPIIIDPAMAFGTGHHETTRSCLALMERWAQRVTRERFLDLGTGTGLLAIAAHKLGFHHVEGVDTDQLAVDAARSNCSVNNATAVRIVPGDLSVVQGDFDMIAANLIAGVLVSIAADLADHLSDGGCAILSGMLQGQEQEVIIAARDAGLRIEETLVEGKWVSLVAARDGGAVRDSSGG